EAQLPALQPLGERLQRERQPAPAPLPVVLGVVGALLLLDLLHLPVAARRGLRRDADGALLVGGQVALADADERAPLRLLQPPVGVLDQRRPAGEPPARHEPAVSELDAGPPGALEPLPGRGLGAEGRGQGERERGVGLHGVPSFSSGTAATGAPGASASTSAAGW